MFFDIVATIEKYLLFGLGISLMLLLALSAAKYLIDAAAAVVRIKRHIFNRRPLGSVGPRRY